MAETQRPARGPRWEPITFATASPQRGEATALAAAIREDEPTTGPPQDAVANLRVIERLLHSAAGDAAIAATDQSR